MFAHTLLNLLDGDLLVLALDDIFQNLMCGRQVDHGSGKRSVGHQADQSAFQLANIRLNGTSDVFGDVIGHLYALAFRFFLQDCDLGLQVGRLNVRDQAPLESRTQAFLDGGNLLGRAIGRNHNLFLLVVERVERVKKFFLRAFAGGDELNVVHHQNVHIAEAVAERRHPLQAD